ncbi:hypothetical protein LCGC14_1152220 [marine sediment metagenome]|uniref:NAD(+)--protein-arginine ADP-ribosyltransferase n=1 Tax=marine sediment metagenome TaxID=412755 RepID=A0A0F9LV31_9ZZZZ
MLALIAHAHTAAPSTRGILGKANRVSPVAIRRALYADRWVPRYRAALQRVLNKQVRQIAAEALVTTPDVGRHLTEWEVELDREKKRWIYPIVITGYELAGKEVTRIEKAGKSDGDVLGKADPLLVPPSISLGREVGGEFLLQGDFESIDTWIATTSVGESRTSATKLEKIWKDAVASRDPETGAAWTPKQISREILRKGLVGNRHRADMLARTGAIWSVNEGAQQRYRAAGVTAEKWLTTKDDARCAYCKGMNGKVVHIDEPFWPAGSEYGNPEINTQSLKLPMEVQHPPLHPRCRCSLIPVILPGDVTTPTPEIKRPRTGVARPARKPKVTAPRVTRPRDTRAARRAWWDNLEPTEKSAVRRWTEFSTDLREIQAGVRTGTKSLRNKNNAFVSAMQKSPRNAQPVWRGLSDVKPSAFRRFQAGKTIELDAFASASTIKKEAAEFAIGDRRNVLLHIRKQSLGTNLKEFQESEVVLHQKEKFRIVKRFYTEREKGAVDYLLNIVLEEV